MPCTRRPLSGLWPVLTAARPRGTSTLGEPRHLPAGQLIIEQFELSPVGGDLAVLRLAANLGDAFGLPSDARLVVAPHVCAGTDATHSYSARGCRLERRLLAGGRRGGSELLWRTAFALPLDIAQAPEAIFRLAASGDLTVALPAPRMRVAAARVPALGLGPSPRAVPRLTITARQRLAALATAVVVTATSGPATALADVGGASSTPAPSASAASTAAGTLTSTATAPATATPAPTTATTTTTAATATATADTATAPSVTTGTSTATVPAAAAAPTPATAATSPPPPASPAAPLGAPTSTAPPAASPSSAPSGVGAPAASSSRAVTVARSGARPRRLTRAGGRLVSVTPTVSDSGRFETSSRVTHLFSAGPRSARVAAGGRVGCGTATSHGAIAYAAAPVRPKGDRHIRPTSCSTTAGGARAGRGSYGMPQGATLTIYPNRPVSHPSPVRPTTSTPTTARPAPSPHHHPGAGDHRPSRDHRSSGGGPVGLPTASHPAAPAPTTAAPATTTTPVNTLSATAPGFLVPTAWTGTVTADPSLTGAVNDLSGLLSDASRPPSFLIPIYMEAGRRYHIPWQVLAAINSIESDYGRDLNTSSAGAVGWMQFEPSTWKQYGLAADGHSVPNPYDPRDAIFTAARYLAAAGAEQNLTSAIFAYNHAGWYVEEVLSRAQAIARHVQYERASLRRGTFSVYFATGVQRHPTVRYRGGILSHLDRLIASANMVSAAQFPYLWGGGHEQPARFGPFDCSGSVSYVLQQAGYKVPTTVSGDVGSWKFPAGPGLVTIFYNPIHTFMRIGNRFFGTSDSRPGGGAGWIDVNRLPAGYLAQFSEAHVPHLGVDSFAPHRRR